jgi:hypothetical protein
MIPSEGLVVVALANQRCDLPSTVVEEIFALLLPGYDERRGERRARERAEKEKRETEQAVQPGGRFLAAPQLAGVWSGSVHTYQGEIPLALEFREAGDVHARLGEQLWTLLNDVELKEGRLTGAMLGQMGTEDTKRLPHHLHASLKLRGEVLNGALIAVSEPRPRSGFALSHWVELRKEG